MYLTTVCMDPEIGEDVRIYPLYVKLPTLYLVYYHSTFIDTFRPSHFPICRQPPI